MRAIASVALRAVGQAISGGGISVAEDDMAGLLSTQDGSGLLHLFENMIIADVGAQHLDPDFAEGNFQAHVRHGRRDYGGSLEDAALLHVARGQKEHGIAIDHFAVAVAE